MQGDLRKEGDLAAFKVMAGMKKADVILSDMAPNFSGSLDIDFYGISELNLLTLSVANNMLSPGGSVLFKTLNGADEA